jgi:hypothetical protein
MLPSTHRHAHPHPTRRFYEHARYAVKQPASPSVEIEPNAQERQLMRRLLAEYARANPQTLQTRLQYFLSDVSGRRLFYFYTRILDAATNRVLCVAREDHYYYIASPDGVPGEQKNIFVKAAEKVKDTLTCFKRGDGLPESETAGDDDDGNNTNEPASNQDPDIISTKL